MKDLYHKLDVEPTANRDELAAALEKQPKLKAYSTILLDDEKRLLYDQVYRTLKKVGTLRFRLDLDKSDTWFIQRYPDFAVMPKPKLTELKRELPATPQARDKRKGSGGRFGVRAGWLLPLLILLIVAAAIGLMLKL